MQSHEIVVQNGKASINGMSITDTQNVMRSYGKVIQFYNKKYLYKVDEKGTQEEIKKYNSAFAVWDHLKREVDRMKEAEFKCR